MKSFFLLVYLKLLNAFFVTKIKKQLGIAFVTTLLQKRYGMVMMIKRTGRGIFYDVTDYLLYKNLLIMQNLEKIIAK